MKKTISFAIMMLVISMCFAGCSSRQNNTPDDIPYCAEIYGPMIRGDYSICEAIDEFEKKTDSLILGYLFGGDIELAKEKMGDEKYGKYFSDILDVRWERFYDYETHTASDNSEELYMGGEICSVRLRAHDKSLSWYPSEYIKCTNDDGKEYFVRERSAYKGGIEQEYMIDLGGNVRYSFEIKSDMEGKEEICQELLEFGFMLKDSVPEWKESTYYTSTEEPSDKNSAGCKSSVMCGAAVMISTAAIGVLCLSKKRKED